MDRRLVLARVKLAQGLEMASRKIILELMKVAGYHEDRETFTYLYVDNHISKQAADAAFRAGQRAKLNGIPCTCRECNDR